jgi:hypothetical protein
MKGIHVNQNLKQWQLHAVAALAVTIVLGVALKEFGTAPKVFASTGQPGESTSYSNENIGTGQPLFTPSNLAEARGDGRLLHVWRGLSDNAVYFQFDGEAPFQANEPTDTRLAPSVSQIGHGRFIAFHVGTNNVIYYAIVDPGDGPDEIVWSEVLFDGTTTMPVSVVQMGSDSGQVFLVWHASTDNNIYSSWFDISTHEWQLPQIVNHGEGNGPPSVFYIPDTNSISVVTEGTDNNLWFTRQGIGAQAWADWGPILNQPSRGNQTMVASPMPGAQMTAVTNINTNGSQTIVVSMLDVNRNPEFASFDTDFNQTTAWMRDTSGFQTNATPNLTTNGNATYSIIDGLDQIAHYKQAWWK